MRMEELREKQKRCMGWTKRKEKKKRKRANVRYRPSLIHTEYLANTR
jgi:hypothetical protein